MCIAERCRYTHSVLALMRRRYLIWMQVQKPYCQPHANGTQAISTTFSCHQQTDYVRVTGVTDHSNLSFVKVQAFDKIYWNGNWFFDNNRRCGRTSTQHLCCVRAELIDRSTNSTARHSFRFNYTKLRSLDTNWRAKVVQRNVRDTHLNARPKWADGTKIARHANGQT